MRQGFLVAVICLAAAMLLTTCGGGNKRAVVQGLRAPEASFSPGSSQESKTSPEGLPAQAGLDYRESISLDDALAEIDAYPTPDGVDAELFAELKDALEEALLTQVESRLSSRDSKDRSGGLQATTPLIAQPGDCASSVVSTTARFVSTPPTGESNLVDDLELIDDGGTYTLTWSYRNSGDYDQNGTVGISDITPIAMHYGETYDPTDENCIQAVVDGSCNYAVDIADITPIAMNFGVDCAGYRIQGGNTPEGTFTSFRNISMETATGEGRLSFSVEFSSATHLYLRVVPYDSEERSGIFSNIVSIPSSGWIHTWGGSNHDNAFALSVDSGGDVYVAGHTWNFGAGSHDVLLLKYSSDGTLLWQKTWGGSSWEKANALAVDSSGQVYVAGKTSGFGAGSSDALLLKYSSTGTQASKRLTQPALQDALLLKYSSTGTLLWQKTWGGSENDYAYTLSVDSSGDVYVGGFTLSFGAGSSDAILLKYSSGGTLLWQKIWAGSSSGHAEGLSLDSSGKAYIGGVASNISGYWGTPSGTETSPAGTETSPSGLASDPSGTESNPTGTETEPDGVEDEGGGYSDVLVMKIDLSGWLD